MFAQVKIHTRNDEPVLVVPQEALIRTGDQERVVLDLGEGRYKSVAVTTGRHSDRAVAVTDGLKAGDRVVTSAQFLIDSESSKTSDFRRLHHGDATMAHADMETVWVQGTVEQLDREQRRARIRHEAIDAWSRPAMTMDFRFADGVSLTGLQAGSTLRFTFEYVDDEFVVRKVKTGTDREEQRHD